MPRANVGAKPWYRCGCTDDTPRRLGNVGSMPFLPWFVPRTEPPVQLRELGSDRGHLLSESCSDVHLHVCRYQTGGEDCCCCSVGSRRKVSPLVLALSLLDRGCCSSVYCSNNECCSGMYVLLLLLVLLLRALQQHEEVVVHRKPSDRIVSGAELCE